MFDSRKRKIPGLWLRGTRCYAQLRVDAGNGTTAPRRKPPEASNLDEPKVALERIRTQPKDPKLPQTGHRPRFEDFTRDYLVLCLSSNRNKSVRGKRVNLPLGNYFAYLRDTTLASEIFAQKKAGTQKLSKAGRLVAGALV